jgi:ribosomal protein L9
LDKRVAAAFPVAKKTMAYPEGQIKSYGSCSRHISVHLFADVSKMILLAIKKACGLMP